MKSLYRFFFPILISGLVFLSTAQAENNYVDALSDEAQGTEMKGGEQSKQTSDTTDKKAPSDVEPAITPSANSDSDSLASKVTGQLEKMLGESDGEVKDEDLAKVVSSAIEEGNSIDDIRNAVNAAMTEIQGSENTEIKPEAVENAFVSLNRIVQDSIQLASGEASDDYILSLNAELEDTTVTTKSDTKSTPEKTTVSESNKTKNKESSKADAETIANTTNKTESEKEDTPDTASANQNQEKATTNEEQNNSTTARTVVVLQGESLSKIANRVYGTGSKYHIIYEANRDVLETPNVVRVGQILKIPKITLEPSE